MKIFDEISLRDFNAWEGAINTKNKILEAGKEDLFEQMIEEIYPDGLRKGELNDFLWFESELIYQTLGIEEENE